MALERNKAEATGQNAKQIHKSLKRKPVSPSEAVEGPSPGGPLFENPFQIDDLMVFDNNTLKELLENGSYGFSLSDLATSLHSYKGPLHRRVLKNLPARKRLNFNRQLHRPVALEKIEEARKRILDGLFWELTYWKTPELYEELTEGEKLHPGIFKKLGPGLVGKTVLDAGAGSGRASFDCLQQGARLVYAVEPSPGLLRILKKKLNKENFKAKIVPIQGRFDRLPLEDNQVDISISCSAFTAESGQGGLPGLKELKRVTRQGGEIVIIWPRQEDREWFKDQGFKYVSLGESREMKVKYRSLHSAKRVAKLFYNKNREVLHYITRRKKPEIPFSVLGFNPPKDYCWLEVTK